MEGPSLTLAVEQLTPFKKKIVRSVSGNTKIRKERMLDCEVRDIFSWGKHLILQFDGFALKTHFLLFGTFEAQVEDVWVTGDYRRAREPRLSLTFDNGVLNMYNCSVKYLEEANVKKTYDFSVDIMARAWDPEKAFAAAREQPDEEIADVLLDQELFSGVGNIIKNEVLSIVRVHPETRISDIADEKLREIIVETRKFSKQFLVWRRKFALRQHFKVHNKGICPHCGGKLTRKHTGKRNRRAFWCLSCQPQVP